MALTETQVMVDGVPTEVDFFIDTNVEYIRSDYSQYAAIYEPGAVVAFREGTRGKFKILDVVGDPDNPTIFVNKGKVVIEAPGADYGMSFNGCSNFRLLGSGDPDNYYYGIEIATTLGKTAAGIGCSSLSEKFELAYLEIHDTGFAGMLLKSDGEIGWTMHDVHIHDNYIHNTEGEGVYIGETKTPSHEVKHVRVHNNLITYSGWEGFQLSNGTEDVKIYNNTLYKTGLDNYNSYQTKGLQIGNWTNADVYNNIVMGSLEELQVNFGCNAATNFYNNYFDGDGDITTGAVFIDNRTEAVEDAPITYDSNWFRDFPYQCFSNYNEVNTLILSNNEWDSNGQGAVFITYLGSEQEAKTTLTNNTETTVEAIQFEDAANNDFRIVDGSYYSDKNLGYETEATEPPITTSPNIDTFTATDLDESSIQLDFTYVDGGLDTGVKIERSLTADNFVQIYASSISSTEFNQYIDSELNDGTTYYYRIRTYLDIANGNYSSIESATTTEVVIPPTAPNAPSDLVASTTSTTSILLEWTDNSTDETGFVIEGSFNMDSGFSEVTTVNANIVQYSLEGLTPSYYQYYRIKAVNANGSSAYSNIVLGVTNAEPTDKYTVQFVYGKNLVYKGDLKGLEGIVPVETGDVVVNGKVISNKEFIAYYDLVTEAQNTLLLQKGLYPTKFVWFEAEPTELIQFDI